jgi:hypothetical protein
MFELKKPDGRTVLVAPAAVARIDETCTSSKWHGINCIVRLFDGTVLECQQDLKTVEKLIKSHTNQTPAAQIPEIDYEALIEAAAISNKNWRPGTTGCVAFARGAQWFRLQVQRHGEQV